MATKTWLRQDFHSLNYQESSCPVLLGFTLDLIEKGMCPIRAAVKDNLVTSRRRQMVVAFESLSGVMIGSRRTLHSISRVNRKDCIQYYEYDSCICKEICGYLMIILERNRRFVQSLL
jgi:hypothetical protein